MLDKLRDQAFQILAATAHCTLSTIGPAGLSASNVAVAINCGQLYILIRNTSDHLFNLEHDGAVVLTAETWELSGSAVQIDAIETPFAEQQTTWSVAYRITPQRMQLAPDDNENTHRTIDFG